MIFNNEKIYELGLNKIKDKLERYVSAAAFVGYITGFNDCSDGVVQGTPVGEGHEGFISTKILRDQINKDPAVIKTRNEFFKLLVDYVAEMGTLQYLEGLEDAQGYSDVGKEEENNER